MFTTDDGYLVLDSDDKPDDVPDSYARDWAFVVIDGMFLPMHRCSSSLSATWVWFQSTKTPCPAGCSTDVVPEDVLEILEFMNGMRRIDGR